MAYTWQTLINEAREILQDTDSDSYRVSNATMINALNRALNALAKLRPDAFWDTFVTDNIVVPQVTSGDLGTTFPYDVIFYPPLVHYVVGSTELMDDEFTTEGRAVALMAAMKQDLVSL